MGGGFYLEFNTRSFGWNKLCFLFATIVAVKLPYFHFFSFSFFAYLVSNACFERKGIYRNHEVAKMQCIR